MLSVTVAVILKCHRGMGGIRDIRFSWCLHEGEYGVSLEEKEREIREIATEVKKDKERERGRCRNRQREST